MIQETGTRTFAQQRVNKRCVLASRVHCSEAFAKILESTGCYLLEERKEPKFEVSGNQPLKRFESFEVKALPCVASHVLDFTLRFPARSVTSVPSLTAVY